MTFTPGYRPLEWSNDLAGRYWRWQAHFPEQYFTRQFGDRIAARLQKLLYGGYASLRRFAFIGGDRGDRVVVVLANGRGDWDHVAVHVGQAKDLWLTLRRAVTQNYALECRDQL